MQTPWNYELNDLEALPDLLTVGEFDTFTNNKYHGDARIEGNIKGASQAVRNWCGWHVYPSTSCSFTGQLGITEAIKLNGTRRGWELLIQLPTALLTAVSSVEIGGMAMLNFSFSSNGLVRVYKLGNANLSSYTPVEVEYTAGVSSDNMSALKDLIAHRVVHAVAVPLGVSSETADGVSITYSQNWANSVRSTALADDNKSVLAPYRVQGVF